MTDDDNRDILAFPMAVPSGWEMMQTGMSLRDWFAGQALDGLLAGRTPGAMYTPEQAAGSAYIIAQAMLVERRKYQGND